MKNITEYLKSEKSEISKIETQYIELKSQKYKNQNKISNIKKSKL